MQDPHFNVFHAYRGAAASEEASLRQLEDNLTRALVITLDLVRESRARLSLLEALHIDESEMTMPYQCHLQVSAASHDWPAQARRRLVVIHGGPQLHTVHSNSQTIRGRVDAVIATNGCLVAVESKLDNVVDQCQLDRHRMTLDIQWAELLDVTWSELARRVRSIPSENRTEPVVDFILTQFEEYLQMNGFGGLTHEHFSYFAHDEGHRDPLVKSGIRRALAAIGDAVAAATTNQWQSYVMNVKADSSEAGVLIQPDPNVKKPHVTIGIDVSGVIIMANVELQNSYHMFMSTWKSDPEGLMRIIRDLGAAPIQTGADAPWRLRILRRVHLGRPMQYHYWVATDVATNTLADWTDDVLHAFIDSVVRKPAGEAAPEITLTRGYSIPQVLDSDDITRQLISDALEIGPFFDWIGVPFRHKETLETTCVSEDGARYVVQNAQRAG